MNKKGNPQNLHPPKIKYTKERIEEIRDLMERYIDENPIPILAEFAYKNKVPRQTLYTFDPLSDTIKRLSDKKQANLEKMSLFGKINTTMAIFSLKQMGWKDRQDVEVSVNTEAYNKLKALYDK